MEPSLRLTYRPLEASDRDLYAALYADPRVMHFAFRDAHPSPEAAHEALQRELASAGGDHVWQHFVGLEKDTGKAVGIVDYVVQFSHELGDICEIGYFLLPAFWGKGYASEMAQALTEALFAGGRTHKVIASCNANNRSSEGIMKKLGMQLEGRHRQERPKRGGWDDELMYGILKQEWAMRPLSGSTHSSIPD